MCVDYNCLELESKWTAAQMKTSRPKAHLQLERLSLTNIVLDVEMECFFLVVRYSLLSNR